MPYRPNQGTEWLTPDQVRSFLRSTGVSDYKTTLAVLDGFDFHQKPIYFTKLEPGDILYQYIRNPSAENGNTVRSGNWFCLKGATQNDIAITGGGSGRLKHQFEVVRSFTTVLGIAKKQSINWEWAGGGDGGGTQIFVPPALVGHIHPLGPAE